MKRQAIFFASFITFIPNCNSKNIGHSLNIGAGIGSHYNNAEFRIREVDPIATTHRKLDLGKSTAAGDLSLGYSFKWNRTMIGLETGYLFSNISRRGDPNALSDGSTTHPIHLKSSGAFQAALKLGYYLNDSNGKNDLVGYIGGGIETRKYKISYVIQDQPDNSIEGNQNKSVFVARVGFDYSMHENAKIGLEYRKAFNNSKTFNNGITTVHFKPENSDTILMNFRWNIDLCNVTKAM